MEVIEETDIKYIHRFRNASKTHSPSPVLQIFVVTFIRKSWIEEFLSEEFIKCNKLGV